MVVGFGVRVTEKLTVADVLAIDALGRPEVESHGVTVGRGLLEGLAVSDARMGMLTMHECTPTAR